MYLIDKNKNNPEITEYIIKFLRSNTCFTKKLKEDTRENPRHKLSVVPNKDNKINMIALFKTKLHVHEVFARDIACTSELNTNQVNEVFYNTFRNERSIRCISQHKEKGI